MFLSALDGPIMHYGAQWRDWGTINHFLDSAVASVTF